MSEHRQQVLLTEDQYQILRKLSFDSRLSISEHIRRAVDLYLKSLKEVE